jgi:hypothetical protein
MGIYEAHKTSRGMTPYLYSSIQKTCHLPVELEHKDYWAIKEINFDVDAMRINKEFN